MDQDKLNDLEQKRPYPSHKKTFGNIVFTLFTIVANALMLYVLVYVSNYSALSKNIFMLVNVGVLALILLLDLLVYFSIRTRKNVVYVFGIILLCLFLVIGGYGTYASIRLQNSIDNMTNTTQTEDVSASLVIYNASSGQAILDEEDLNGRVIGVLDGAHTGEIAKSRLEKKGVTATYKGYAGYTEIFRALINGEIDCGVMTTTWASLVEEEPTLSAYIDSCSSLADFSDSVVETNNSGADKDLTKEPFTVLLTGENEGLADTIMVISVNPISLKVTMTSIPRDSYVPITCYGNVSSKINGAHASSEACMVSTVEKLLGVTIDYTVEFDFASVIQVVDAVGGVDVDISVGFDAQCWDIENDELVVYHLDPGDNVHLNGTLALGFARERYAFPDGDFARQRHQQEIISQVLSKIMATKNPNTILDVMDAAGNNIQTNFTRDQLVNFLSYAMKKAGRYWGDSLSDVFQICTSRVYGYDSSIYDAGLNMDLYIYRLYPKSITETKKAIDRNTNLNSTIEESIPVDWSGSEEYTAPNISA